MADNEVLELLDRCADTAYNCGSVTVSKAEMMDIYGFVDRKMAEIDELREVVDGFMDFVPTCTHCDGKTSDGERTEHCLYDIDYNESIIYCGKKAIELYLKLKSDLATAKAEAIKEFAERVKERCHPFQMHGVPDVLATSAEQIDNLAKELVGDTDG